MELALLRCACTGLYLGAVSRWHLWRTATVSERGGAGDTAGVRATCIGTLATAEGCRDRGHDAPRRAIGSCRRSIGLTGDGGAHRGVGGRDQWADVVASRCQIERCARWWGPQRP